jgi:hypothetical protein
MAEPQAPALDDRERASAPAGEVRTRISDGIVALIKHYYA